MDKLGNALTIPPKGEEPVKIAEEPAEKPAPAPRPTASKIKMDEHGQVLSDLNPQRMAEAVLEKRKTFSFPIVAQPAPPPVADQPAASKIEMDEHGQELSDLNPQRTAEAALEKRKTFSFPITK